MTLNFTEAIKQINEEMAKLQRVKDALMEFTPLQNNDGIIPSVWKIAKPAKPARRAFSPEALERIKEAQRARWAKWNRERRRAARERSR